MSFVSSNFFIFLGIFGACYFLAPQRLRWFVLLVSSYVFYWFVGGGFAVAIISGTIFTVYISGVLAGALRELKADRFVRRLPLALCLTLNFGLLLILILDGHVAHRFALFLIPGVSFYTFQAAGYLIDIYRGKIVPERNILRVALFLSFFPQLVQGPISRHSEISSDLFAGHDWDWERSRRGVLRIIWGYFMWVVIANRAAPIVNTVFANYSNYGGAIIVFGVLMYTIQIYSDFAGGIYIALGIAEILGISLPKNFRQPFFATSLADFWRRWHMTLTRWLRDYLFYPIAMSKPLSKLGKSSRRIFRGRAGKMLAPSVATFCVYIVIGVWHGAGAQIILFGLLNGTLITASLYFEPQIAQLRVITGINGDGRGKAFAMLRTFALLMFLRYFARAESLPHALRMLRQTVSDFRAYELWDATVLNLGVGANGYIVLAFGLVFLLASDIISEKGIDWREKLIGANPVLQFSVLFVSLALITIFGIYAGDTLSANFIYAAH